MHRKGFFAILLVAVLAFAASPAFAQPAKGPVKLKPGTYAHFDTSMGAFSVRLFTDRAPKAVANFVGLAEGKIDTITGGPGRGKPYYDGVTFHRVIDGFMIQGGDPTGTGSGGPGYTIRDEFDPKFRFNRAGIMAMANRSIPNSSASQFFITVAPYPSLNGKYTPFGEVVSGLDVVKKIAKVKKDNNDRPLQKVVIRKVTIERVN